MRIFYISNTCSKEKYYEYIESKGLRVSQQAQKYNLLLAEGLVKLGLDVELISSRPINRFVSKKIFFHKERQKSNGINFLYLRFLNIKFFRSFFLFWGTFLRIFIRGKKDKDFVVCDALNISSALGAIIASKIKGIKIIGIITDVPCHLSNMENIPFHQKINFKIMHKFDGYLFLTEYMNGLLNMKHKPYIVLEGHSDAAMGKRDNCLSMKVKKRICLYAGSLKKVYGINNLVEGFIEANIFNTELHIYGNGDYVEELKKICSIYDNVKYFGIVSNSVMVEKEIEATLLVNPRPTNEEYTKYSFPSKNMEYMASGTPLLTTKLPGMPLDHLNYVYLIDDESSKGISEALKKVLLNSDTELNIFGNKAKKFILEEKSNEKQAGKVLEFLQKNY